MFKQLGCIHKLWGGAGAGRLRTLVRRGTLACLLACLVPVVAGAYTVVTRGGRRVEIPDRFLVTRTTLTYEAAPGINVTLQLSQVDIAATERANGEPAGSLLSRAGGAARAERGAVFAGRTGAQAAPRGRQGGHAARTLTNRELEGVRRERLESERAYERRRRELGLPTLEESRRSVEESERALREMARRRGEEEAREEDYWRARAAELRTELAVLDAEIDYVRGRLTEPQVQPTLSSFGFVTVGPVFARPAFPPLLPPRLGLHGPAFPPFGAPRGTGAQLSAHVSVGGGTRAFFDFTRRDVRGLYARRFFHPGVFAPGFVGLVAPFNYASVGYEALAIRLHELEAARAGLSERWRLLEEEARRAGAPPGWLRP